MTEEFNKAEFLKSSGNDFFLLLEKHLNAKVPDLVKNNLMLCEYNSPIVMAKFDDAALNNIETFLQKDFDKEILLENELPEHYLGRYVKFQRKFQFMDGHKKWFEIISQACRSLIEENDVLIPFTTGENDDTYEKPNDNNANSLFNLIGSQMISVFTDSKRITLSAWSWPAREVSSQLSSHFKNTGTIKDNIDLLYTTPAHHEELLDCIVQTDLVHFQSLILTSLAASLRIDGSVDRMQKHNVYVLLHVISQSGKLKTFFLGFGIPVGNGALEYHNVTKDIAKKLIPWNDLLSLTTSLVTDGEKKNSGHLSGLWKRLKDDKANLSSGPMITIWCIAHLANLSWTDIKYKTMAR